MCRKTNISCSHTFVYWHRTVWIWQFSDLLATRQFYNVFFIFFVKKCSKNSRYLLARKKTVSIQSMFFTEYEVVYDYWKLTWSFSRKFKFQRMHLFLCSTDVFSHYMDILKHYYLDVKLSMLYWPCWILNKRLQALHDNIDNCNTNPNFQT